MRETSTIWRLALLRPAHSPTSGTEKENGTFYIDIDEHGWTTGAKVQWLNMFYIHLLPATASNHSDAFSQSDGSCGPGDLWVEERETQQSSHHIGPFLQQTGIAGMPLGGWKASVHWGRCHCNVDSGAVHFCLNTHTSSLVGYISTCAFNFVSVQLLQFQKADMFTMGAVPRPCAQIHYSLSEKHLRRVCTLTCMQILFDSFSRSFPCLNNIDRFNLLQNID